MDVSHILDHLNDQQREAVTSEKKHLNGSWLELDQAKQESLFIKIAWEVEALNKNPVQLWR